MAVKDRPNYESYLQILRALTPKQRLSKAGEMSVLVKELVREGLKK